MSAVEDELNMLEHGIECPQIEFAAPGIISSVDVRMKASTLLPSWLTAPFIGGVLPSRGPSVQLGLYKYQ